MADSTHSWRQSDGITASTVRASGTLEPEFAVGQTWRRRSHWRITTHITIERLAARTVFGPMRIGDIPMTKRGQVSYTQLRAKWERVDG